MEAEIRDILTSAVTEKSSQTDLFSALTERFARLDGVDLDIPAQATSPRAADLPN